MKEKEQGELWPNNALQRTGPRMVVHRCRFTGFTSHSRPLNAGRIHSLPKGIPSGQCRCSSRYDPDATCRIGTSGQRHCPPSLSLRRVNGLPKLMRHLRREFG
jgi:hypothetical protein